MDTVVEPDLAVICDPSKLDDRGCRGAQDMVVKILSPSTQRHDRLVKLRLYQRAGVWEYWIVNLEDQTVQVMLLDHNGVLQLHSEKFRNFGIFCCLQQFTMLLTSGPSGCASRNLWL